MKPFSGGLKKSNNHYDSPLEKTGKSSDLSDFAKLLNGEERLSQESFWEILEFLREILGALTKKRLNTKQLKLLSEIERNEGLLYYQLINKLSREQGLPKSTVRWNLNKLREAKMVITGDKNNKGIPVKLTKRGKMLVLALKNGE